jgi:hypothetical protein
MNRTVVVPVGLFTLACLGFLAPGCSSAQACYRPGAYDRIVVWQPSRAGCVVMTLRYPSADGESFKLSTPPGTSLDPSYTFLLPGDCRLAFDPSVPASSRLPVRDGRGSIELQEAADPDSAYGTLTSSVSLVFGPRQQPVKRAALRTRAVPIAAGCAAF